MNVHFSLGNRVALIILDKSWCALFNTEKLDDLKTVICRPNHFLKMFIEIYNFKLYFV